MTDSIRTKQRSGQNFGHEAKVESECVASWSKTRPKFRLLGRGRNIETAADATWLATSLRPKFSIRALNRGQRFASKVRSLRIENGPGRKEWSVKGAVRTSHANDMNSSTLVRRRWRSFWTLSGEWTRVVDDAELADVIAERGRCGQTIPAAASSTWPAKGVDGGPRTTIGGWCR